MTVSVPVSAPTSVSAPVIVPVILSGGSGSRLWPLSRSRFPKQFLPLMNEFSLLQNTIHRLDGLTHLSSPILIVNEDHRFLAAEQLRQVGCQPKAIILEPVGKNTAPAVALAAIKTQREGLDPVLLVLAADHAINDQAAFHRAVETALPAAAAGKLVTFGIIPTHPETGYGYIKVSQLNTCSAVNKGCCIVDAFVEKPDLDKAEAYLNSGDYYWNSGMFMFTASSFLSALKKHRPEIYAACEQAIAEEHPDLDFIRLNEAVFQSCPSDSIDYAVMEKTKDAVMVPLDAGWSDVGSWSSLWDVLEKDAASNVTEGDVLLHDTQNSFIYSQEKLIATVGVKDLIVVESDDAILISTKHRVQEVKQVVEDLKQHKRPEASCHRKVFRPWGTYDSIDMGDRFQVKRITIKPGAQISLQKHYHRAEHWVVVRGTALVIKGGEELLLTENQSTYIPIGEVHRLTNPGKFDLEIIEIQSGSYLGEDDIERIEDTYGRS